MERVGEILEMRAQGVVGLKTTEASILATLLCSTWFHFSGSESFQSVELESHTPMSFWAALGVCVHLLRSRQSSWMSLDSSSELLKLIVHEVFVNGVTVGVTSVLCFSTIAQWETWTCREEQPCMMLVSKKHCTF